jgi:hypothetical protein
MKKLVMVEVLSQHRIRYAVEVKDDIDHAVDEYICRENDISFKEFSQQHLEPSVLIDHYEITEEEYLAMFDKDNDYLQSWTKEQKLNLVNKIDYKENE